MRGQCPAIVGEGRQAGCPIHESRLAQPVDVGVDCDSGQAPTTQRPYADARGGVLGNGLPPWPDELVEVPSLFLRYVVIQLEILAEAEAGEPEKASLTWNSYGQCWTGPDERPRPKCRPTYRVGMP